jgi:RNA polymerase sigma factor (sigma-70 family)
MEDEMDAREFESLYQQLDRPLHRVVRRAVDADRTVIEDACQMAWGQFVDHRHRVDPDRVLAWLATTAIREARRVSGAGLCEVSLDELMEAEGRGRAPAAAACVEETVTLRQRLREVTELPPRQQKLIWLHGFGLNYAEIAGYTGESRRTVERQLLRAKRALRAA